MANNVNTQSQGFEAPFTIARAPSPSYAMLQAQDNIAPVIASFAVNPFDQEFTNMFKDSPLAKIWGFDPSRELQPNQAGLMKMSSFMAVNRTATSSYAFSIFNRKRMFSMLKLNANTVAAGAPNAVVTAVFDIAQGGYPAAVGNVLLVKDLAGQQIEVRVLTISQSAQLQTVTFTNVEDGITIGVIPTTSNIINLSMQSPTRGITAGQIADPADYKREYELGSYRVRYSDVYFVDNLMEKKWYQVTDNGSSDLLNMVSNGMKGKYQFWISDMLTEMVAQEAMKLNNSLMFNNEPTLPNANAYPVITGGDTIPVYDGIVTQIKKIGYNVTYVLGAMTLADLGNVAKAFKQDGMSGFEFEVFAGTGWIENADAASLLSTQTNTLLTVTQGMQNRPEGFYNQMGFSGFQNYNGGTFAWKDMPVFSALTMGGDTGPYYNSAIIMPLEIQASYINGVKTNCPSIMLAYNADVESPLVNRSNGAYSGEQGMMPFVKVITYAHPDLIDKFQTGHAVKVERSSVGADIEFSVQPHCPVVTCAEKTAFMHPA